MTTFMELISVLANPVSRQNEIPQSLPNSAVMYWLILLPS